MKITDAFVFVEIDGDGDLRQVALSKEQRRLIVSIIQTSQFATDGKLLVLEKPVCEIENAKKEKG